MKTYGEYFENRTAHDVMEEWSEHRDEWRSASDMESLGVLKYRTKSEQETELLGEKAASIFRAGDVVAMRGGMGAGKTAFVRGLARGLGEKNRVTSPTYTIVNEYETTPPLFHFDLYRLGSFDELFEIGFDDYLTRGGVCVIEWSENAGDDISFTHYIRIERDPEDENCRNITISEA